MVDVRVLRFFQMAYYMDKLGMIHTYFQILPWVLVGSGVISFLIATAGFIFSSTVEVSCWMIGFGIELLGFVTEN